MSYKLIVFDIDGTIREPGFEISNQLKKTVKLLKNMGVSVTLATGRSLQSASQFIKELQINSPIIVSQGSLIWDPGSTSILREVTMKPTMVKMAIDSLIKHEVDVLIYLRDKILVSRMSTWISDYSKRTNIGVEVIGDLNHAINSNPLRILGVGEESLISEISKHLSNQIGSNLYITKSLPMFCEILHPNGGKATALRWLTNWLNIKLDETIVFANGLEDIEMLKICGFGVSMSGSPVELIRASSLVASPVKNDGVSKVLKYFLANRKFG